MKLSLSLFFLFGLIASAHAETRNLRFVQIPAKTKEDRTAIANRGVSIEAVRSDSVWGFASPSALKRLAEAGIPLLGNFDFRVARGGHENSGLGSLDFPQEDSKFHTYAQTQQALQDLVTANPDLARLSSIGKTVEGRDLWALHLNSSPDALKSGTSTQPGAIFMGNHHAREHLSNEMPLLLAQYLLKNRSDATVANLLTTRDIWIIPMVNPDGVEFDIKTGEYQMWRKNRVDNRDGTFGVDLNRNYSFKWGTGGSDTETDSEVYMGPKPFSEPETIAIKNFVEAHLNAKTLLTFHTYSELVLYPWGNTYDKVGNAKDLAAFEKMATTMAGWNHYTPEQTSSLYIASGDTTDWAYGEHGIFAFTFEMSPNSETGGGFYPGEAMIDKVFADNLKPCLYLIDVADDPYKVIDSQPTDGLKYYVAPRLSENLFFE